MLGEEHAEKCLENALTSGFTGSVTCWNMLGTCFS
jgi:hypothetical protein